MITSAQGREPTSATLAGASGEDPERVAALRRGDEMAFVELVRGLHGSMLRLAMAYVSSQAIAEEVVQEAWLGVLRQIHNFEGRSSLKTWILRIAANLAKTRGAQERRSVPFSAVADPGAEAGEPPVAPARFFDPATAGPVTGRHRRPAGKMSPRSGCSRWRPPAASGRRSTSFRRASGR